MITERNPFKGKKAAERLLRWAELAGQHLPAETLDLASLRLALHRDEELDTREFSRQFYADSEAYHEVFEYGVARSWRVA